MKCLYGEPERKQKYEPTRILASYAAKLKYEGLPEEVIKGMDGKPLLDKVGELGYDLPEEVWLFSFHNLR